MSKPHAVAGEAILTDEYSLHLPHERRRVWNLLRDVTRAPEIVPTCLRAFTVPGTPAGVGQQSVFVNRPGGAEHLRLVLVELTAEELGRLLAWRDLTTGMQSSIRLTDRDDGVFLDLVNTWTPTPAQRQFLDCERLLNGTTMMAAGAIRRALDTELAVAATAIAPSP